MSGNLTAVREMSGILLKVGNVREKIVSGKSCLKLFIVSCIFASIQVFSRVCSVLNIWFRFMHCCIPTPTTDSNTSTGMIWVTPNTECRGGLPRTVGEFHIVWRVVTLYRRLILTALVCVIFVQGQWTTENNDIQKFARQLVSSATAFVVF